MTVSKSKQCGSSDPVLRLPFIPLNFRRDVLRVPTEDETWQSQYKNQYREENACNGEDEHILSASIWFFRSAESHGVDIIHSEHCTTKESWLLALIRDKLSKLEFNQWLVNSCELTSNYDAKGYSGEHNAVQNLKEPSNECQIFGGSTASLVSTWVVLLPPAVSGTVCFFLSGGRICYFCRPNPLPILSVFVPRSNKNEKQSTDGNIKTLPCNDSTVVLLLHEENEVTAFAVSTVAQAINDDECKSATSRAFVPHTTFVFFEEEVFYSPKNACLPDESIPFKQPELEWVFRGGGKQDDFVIPSLRWIRLCNVMRFKLRGREKTTGIVALSSDVSLMDCSIPSVFHSPSFDDFKEMEGFLKNYSFQNSSCARTARNSPRMIIDEGESVEKLDFLYQELNDYFILATGDKPCVSLHCVSGLLDKGASSIDRWDRFGVFTTAVDILSTVKQSGVGGLLNFLVTPTAQGKGNDDMKERNVQQPSFPSGLQDQTEGNGSGVKIATNDAKKDNENLNTRDRNERNTFNKELTPLLEIPLKVFGFDDVSRVLGSPSVCPWDSRLAVAADSLARVVVFQLPNLQPLYMWRGYRKAQVAWLQNPLAPPGHSTAGCKFGTADHACSFSLAARSLRNKYGKESDNFEPDDQSQRENAPIASEALLQTAEADDFCDLDDVSFFDFTTCLLGGLLIYAPRRGLMELWDVYGLRRFAMATGVMDNGVLLTTNNSCALLATSVMQIIKWPSHSF